MNSQKIEQLKALLKANENDMLNADRRFQSLSNRFSVKQELAAERRLLLEQWEKLTGTPAPEPTAGKKDDDGGKELVHA
jgi:hypothetical protein